MIGSIFSADLFGTEASVVRIEGASENGNPAIILTGLVSQEVKESQERIKVAVRRLGCDAPRSRLLLHLHPSDRPKRGSHWDLPLALVVLATEGMAGVEVSHCGAVGTLGLTGEINPVPGALAMVQALSRYAELKILLVPRGNPEVALISDPRIRWVGSLAEAVAVLRGTQGPQAAPPPPLCPSSAREGPFLFDQVRGHPFAKRTLEVALAGRHSVLWVGPPGVGKTFLAERAVDLLPSLSPLEQIEVAKTHMDGGFLVDRPFRAPHHSIPASRLLGGGTGKIQAGEVTLAHLGVLFLDEIGEFRRDALEGLREPLQNGAIEIHRGAHHCRLPARFTLVAAMNPCPCGFSLGGQRRCACLPREVSRYRKRLSGPIRDRFDMVAMMGLEDDAGPGEGARLVRSRIQRAWDRQRERWGDLKRNSDMNPQDMEPLSHDPSLHRWLEEWDGAKHPRTRAKILQLAQTLADLGGAGSLATQHLEEAWLLSQSQRNWEDLSTVS